MNAQITISNIWYNKTKLGEWFFRSQAMQTLEELVDRSDVITITETLSELDAATEDMDIDDVEEMFYSESVEYCAAELGIKLAEADEDEDE